MYFVRHQQLMPGKEVRIELTTHTGKYAGVVNEIYCGDKSELWEYIFEKYGITMIIAFFLLFAGAVTIIFSIALGIVYHSKFDMEYLGWCILLAAAWMIGESNCGRFWSRMLLHCHSCASYDHAWTAANYLLY